MYGSHSSEYVGRSPYQDGAWIGLAISLLIHVVIGLLLLIIEPPESERRQLVSLKLIDKEPPSAGLDDGSVQALDGQVVDIPRPEREETPPPDARFLSRYNTRVDREQKTRHRGRRIHRPSGGEKRARAMDADGRGKKKGRRLGEEKKVDVVVALPRRHDGDSDGPKGGLGGLAMLMMPGVGRYSDGAGSGPWRPGVFLSDDAVLGVQEEGDATLVNSRSFKYWDFFQRVKDRVREEWNPGTAFRARDPNGKVYGSRDRLTVLAVVMDSGGSLLRMEVIRESGLPFLDREAMGSFKDAAPFPNPPDGLADERGRIAFNFGFLLDLSSSKSRFFWQRP